MKIAITGATGFIGKNLIHAIQLNDIDTEIVAIGRNASALNNLFNSEESQKLKPNIKGVIIDIHNPPKKAYELMGSPDMLIHLAWGGLPDYSSFHHFESELPKHYEFLSGLVNDGLKSIVVTGTCFEYGMKEGELNETMQVEPDNPYGLAKNTLRLQLEHLQKETYFNLTWARLFYIYGDNQTGNSIFPQLKRAINNGDELFNMSKGEQIRDYLNVLQVVKYLEHLIFLNKNIGLINVCSGKPISVRRLVEEWLLKNAWNIKLNLGYYPYPSYEPFAFWGCSKKLHAIMGELSNE